MTDSRKASPAAYRVFVMRIWQDGSASPVWRFSLEDPTTGQRRGFACLADLTAYLENLIRPTANPPKARQALTFRER